MSQLFEDHSSRPARLCPLRTEVWETWSHSTRRHPCFLWKAETSLETLKHFFFFLFPAVNDSFDELNYDKNLINLIQRRNYKKHDKNLAFDAKIKTCCGDGSGKFLQLSHLIETNRNQWIPGRKPDNLYRVLILLIWSHSFHLKVRLRKCSAVLKDGETVKLFHYRLFFLANMSHFWVFLCQHVSFNKETQQLPFRLDFKGSKPEKDTSVAL